MDVIDLLRSCRRWMRQTIQTMYTTRQRSVLLYSRSIASYLRGIETHEIEITNVMHAKEKEAREHTAERNNRDPQRNISNIVA